MAGNVQGPWWIKINDTVSVPCSLQCDREVAKAKIKIKILGLILLFALLLCVFVNFPKKKNVNK